MNYREGSSTNSLDNGEMYVWDMPGSIPWTKENVDELIRRQNDFTERRRQHQLKQAAEGD